MLRAVAAHVRNMLETKPRRHNAKPADFSSAGNTMLKIPGESAFPAVGYHTMGSLPTDRRYSLAREKWRHPKNPR